MVGRLPYYKGLNTWSSCCLYQEKSLSSVSHGSPPPSKPHPVHPSRIFTLGYCNLPISLESDCYLYISTFPYTVDIYNLEPEKTVSGAVDIVAPDDWTGENLTRQVTIPPMEGGRIEHG